MYQVIAIITVYLVDAAPAIDIIVAAVAMDKVVCITAKYLVLAATTIDLCTACTVMDDVVYAATAKQEYIRTIDTCIYVVITAIAIYPSLPTALVDEYIVACTSVEFDIGSNTFLYINMVITMSTIGHNLFNALEDGLTTTKLDPHGLAFCSVSGVLDHVKLIADAIADPTLCISGTHIQI